MKLSALAGAGPVRTPNQRPECPRCGSFAHVIQELPRGADGRLDVFEPDSHIYTCSRFGAAKSRGCGHKWNELARRHREALRHLTIARVQMIDTDDGIICGHIDDAIKALSLRVTR